MSRLVDQGVSLSVGPHRTARRCPSLEIVAIPCPRLRAQRSVDCLRMGAGHQNKVQYLVESKLDLEKEVTIGTACELIRLWTAAMMQ